MYSFITYNFRIKDSACSKLLSKKASDVNSIWNYCNETSMKAWKRDRNWISAYDLHKLTTGSNKFFELHSQTIQAICQEHYLRRKKHKKCKLSWRSFKRSLGWIPFKKVGIQLKGSKIKYLGKTYRFWKSREIEGEVRCGSFSQDSRGRWYINITCKVKNEESKDKSKPVGVDLGLKTQATLSNGTKLQRENITKKHEDKLAMAQRANKKRLTKSIHAKIKNIRKDWNHKATTWLAKTYDQIFVGNVKPKSFISKKCRFSKSVTDASWFAFKSMLEYKAILLGIDFREIDESFSTVTCSNCFNRTGPSGLSDLGVRSWVCPNCDSHHDRDVNAAQNILKVGLGHQALKGISPL